MTGPHQRSNGPSEPVGTDDATPQTVPAPGRTRSRLATTWLSSGSGYAATIDGRDYRVTKYPAGSPMTAPYGAYAEGRFIGSGPTLDNVKGRCNAHAARLRARAPVPDAE